MPNNGFGLDPQEYEKISNNEAYFRGRVVEQLNQVKAELEKQSIIDERITDKMNSLPCSKYGNRVKIAFLLIAILFCLFGYENMPLLIRFFGF